MPDGSRRRRGSSRLARVGREDTPDLADRILAEVALPAAQVRRRRRLAQLGLAAVGLVQIAIAVPALFGNTIDMAMVTHAAHESAAWNVALGAAFLATAFAPRRAAGLLPLLVAFVGVLVVLVGPRPRVRSGRTRAAGDASRRCGRAGAGVRAVRQRAGDAATGLGRRWDRSARRTGPRLAGSRVRRLAALITLVAGLFGLGLLAATSAAAHAVVVSSNPADGARLAAAPSNVSVTFDESVGLGGGGYLRVVDQVGRRVDNGSATHPGGDGTKISVPMRAGLGDGTYTASYRVVSADSHPVAGAIRFVVGNGALGAGASGPQTVDRLTSTTFDVVRWISFAGLAVLGGGWLMFSVWPAGRDDRRARDTALDSAGVRPQPARWPS